MAKKLFQLYLEPDELKYVEQVAQKVRRSKAAVVRELIQDDMRKAQAWERVKEQEGE